MQFSAKNVLVLEESNEVSLETAYGSKIWKDKLNDIGALVDANIDELLIYVRIENNDNMKKFPYHHVLVDLCFAEYRNSCEYIYSIGHGYCICDVPLYK